MLVYPFLQQCHSSTGDGRSDEAPVGLINDQQRSNVETRLKHLSKLFLLHPYTSRIIGIAEPDHIRLLTHNTSLQFDQIKLKLLRFVGLKLVNSSTNRQRCGAIFAK